VVAAYRAIARSDAFSGGIAKMLHDAILQMCALGEEVVLPVLIHGGIRFRCGAILP
jgi:hypothetical protein